MLLCIPTEAYCEVVNVAQYFTCVENNSMGYVLVA